MVNYAAGQQIALAGIPGDRINRIAQDYVHQNLASVGATQVNYNQAVEITSHVTGGTTAQKLESLEELRAAALRGKTPQQAEQINKNYDLAMAYYGMRQELLDAQRAGGTQPYRLPALNARIARSTTVVGSQFGPSYVPAGSWRATADEAAQSARERQEVIRLASLAPIDAALAELPAADRRAVSNMIRSATRDARANGVSEDGLPANIIQAFEAQDTGWGDTVADKAQRAVARAQEIAAQRGQARIQDKPTAEQAIQFANLSPRASGGGFDLVSPAHAATRPAAAAGAVMFGTNNTRYGQSVSIAPADARNTASVAILSGANARGNHFNRAQVNEYLAQIPVQEQYSNAQLRELHNQQAAATDIGVKNSIQAVIGILTLENRFAEERARGKNTMRMFASNNEVMGFFNTAVSKAGTYATDDQSVAPVAATTAQSGGRATTRTGIRVYGRKDGTPAPNPDEVPALMDEAQVRALQTRLGVTVDGMYGPETHAAMLAAAQRQNKQPREFDFTLQGVFDAFIAALTGTAPAATASADAPATTTPDLRTQLAPQLAAVASISDAPLTLAQLQSQRAALTAALQNSGLTPQKLAEFEQCSNIDILAGTCTNSILAGVEQALGLTVDAKPDARIIALLTDPTAGPMIARAINAGSITAVASATGNGAPSVPGGAGGQATGR